MDLKTIPTRVWVIGGTVAVVVIFLISYFSALSSVKTRGVSFETQLTAQYQSNQVELSKYVSTFYETTGVAKVKTDKLNDILLNAVKGRYDTANGTLDATRGQGQLFSAISEAYPSLTGLDVYDKIVDFIQTGRERFANKQNQLLDVRRSYDAWRNKGLLHPILVRQAGFPSTKTLRAKVGGKTYTGQAALDQMDTLVLTSGVDKAFETGEQAPLTVNP